jgi:hypothetical protein
MRENQIFPVLKMLTGGGSAYEATKPFVAADYSMTYPLPDNAITLPWHAAAIFNVVDYSTSPLDGDEEFRLADRTVIHTDAFAPVPLSGLYQNMDAMIANALIWAEGLYTPLEDYAGDYPSWPDDFSQLGMTARLVYEKPVDAATAIALEQSLADLELVMAWSGFQTEEFDYDYWNTTQVPYPVIRTSEAAGMTYEVEAPVGNPAITLYLFNALAQMRHGVTVKSGTFEFSELW